MPKVHHATCQYAFRRPFDRPAGRMQQQQQCRTEHVDDLGHRVIGRPVCNRFIHGEPFVDDA